MPVHLEERNGRHCVVEPSGKPKKCYDDRDDAVDYLQAINANVYDKTHTKAISPTIRGVLEAKIHRSFTLAADDLFGLGYISREQRIELSSLISDMLTTFGENIDPEIADYPVGLSDSQAIMRTKDGEDAMGDIISGTDVTFGPSDTISGAGSTGTVTQAVKSGSTSNPEPTEEKEQDEKGLYGPPPMSFEDLEKERQAYAEQQQAAELLGDFMSIAGNIVTYQDDKLSGLRKLAKEFMSRIGVGEEEDEDEEYDEKENPYLPDEYKQRLKEETEKIIKETWSQAYINDLPDSAFLFIESGGKKDSEGKTTPRSLRHLPYKNSEGSVDVPHVRNAIARAGQVKLKDGSKISESKASQLKDRARKILAQNTKGSVMIWKQDDGTWRWFGTYSNKFRDDDYPEREIIAEKAHQKFIDRVRSGELGYPDLYVWHIPVSVGKADLLAYDSSGFSVVSGTFTNDKVALALTKTNKDLAMSHGMPTEFIVREKDDPTVITEYVSTEVSVLPRYAAANKMTDFRIISKEEKGMTFPVEQRDGVVKLLGEDATAELENDLADKAINANAAGIDHKQEGKPEGDEPEEKSTDADAAPADASAQAEPAVDDVSDEPVSDEPAGEPADAEPAGDEPASDEPAGDAGEGDLKKEIVGILATFTKELDQKLEQTNQQFNERLGALEEKITDMEKGDDEKIADKAASMPTASLAAMLAKHLQGDTQADSVIGNQATHVHGNSSLAKDKPAEADGDAPEQGGLFFQRWTGRQGN